MAAMAPLLTHLPPPYSYGSIRLDRFSPNFVKAGEMGFTDVRPFESYRYVYAVPEAALRNLAYFFEFGYRDGRDPSTYVRPLVPALRQWQRAHRTSDLFSLDVDERLLIWDFRPCATRVLFTLSGIDRLLYRACDQIAEVGALTALALDHGLTDADLRSRLERLVTDGLLIADRSRYLALAIAVGAYQPARHIVARMFREIRRLGRMPGARPITIDGPLPRTRLSAARFSTSSDGTVVVRSASGGPA
jgi:hypothetical protein